MDVTQVTSARTASGGTATSGAPSDYDTFLKLLTVQMQNQDPLNPIDSSDYAVQLATFSGVEQQTRTNDLLGGIQSDMAAMGLAELANWVGKDIRAAMPVEIVDGAPVTLLSSPAPGADRAVMVVTDSQGTVVNRVDLGPDAEEFAWAPVDMAGAPLPDGVYRFALESLRNDEPIDTVDMDVFATVSEVQSSSYGPVLVMPGDIAVLSSAVASVRN